MELNKRRAGLALATALSLSSCDGPDRKPTSFVLKTDGFEIACREVLNGKSALDPDQYCPENDPLKKVNIPPLSAAEKEIMYAVRQVVSCVYYELWGYQITDKEPPAGDPKIPVFIGGVSKPLQNGGHVGGITILSDLNRRIYVPTEEKNGGNKSPAELAAILTHEMAHAILGNEYHNPDAANPSLLSLQLPITPAGEIVWRFTPSEAEKLVNAGSLFEESQERRNRKIRTISDPKTHCADFIKDLRNTRRGR